MIYNTYIESDRKKKLWLNKILWEIHINITSYYTISVLRVSMYDQTNSDIDEEWVGTQKPRIFTFEKNSLGAQTAFRIYVTDKCPPKNNVIYNTYSRV